LKSESLQSLSVSDLSKILSRLTDDEAKSLLVTLTTERKDRERLSSDKYVCFKTTYRDRPDLFVAECIDWERVRASDGPADYQLEILASLPEAKRISARGPHGLGKSALEAWIMLWFVLTRDGEDWKAISTASAWRQLSVYLWPEIHKWSGLLDWGKIGREQFIEKRELLDLQIKLSKKVASAVASNDHEKVEGAHADNVLILFDEAKIIPDATWDALEGAMSVGECYACAVSTPGAPLGRFHDIQMRKIGYEDWAVRHVTLEEAIAAGRIDQKWADDRKRQWGETSALYKNRVKGEFAETSSDGVIPLAWVEAANERWKRWNDAGRPGKYVGVGADIGETDDPTVLAPKYESVVLPATSGEDELALDCAVGDLEEHTGLTTMQSVAKIEAWHRKRSVHTYSVVDSIGIGSGVVSRLRELSHIVIPFTASAKSEATDESGEIGFANKRAEAWWNAREMLDPAGHSLIALPPDDELTGELTAPKYREISGGKILVESKADIKKRLDGRSTNKADAVIQILNERAVNFEGEYRSVSKRRSERRARVWK
jgi:hypothetical protein